MHLIERNVIYISKTYRFDVCSIVLSQTNTNI